jgi:hypothetical protein
MKSGGKNSKYYSALLNTPDFTKTNPEIVRELAIVRYRASANLRKIEIGQNIARVELINMRYKG